MANLSFKFTAVLVVLMFTFKMVATSNGQDGSSDPFGGDPFGGMIDSTQKNQAIQPQDNGTQTHSSSSKSSESEITHTRTNRTPFPNSQNENKTTETGTTENNSAPVYNSQSGQPQTNSETPLQDAVIEGIQLTTEKNEKQTDEKTISCYFIFRDKPSSYFYEVKIREKKIVFEFNDTRVGTSPVPAVSELPIKGFSIEQKRVDVNKDVRGLIPEWHDMIKVTFDMEAVPIIHVNDEYSLISYNFKWTSDPAKLAKYTLRDNTPKVILWSSTGIGCIGLGTLAYFMLHKEPPPPQLGPIPIGDLPDHPVQSK